MTKILISITASILGIISITFFYNATLVIICVLVAALSCGMQLHKTFTQGELVEDEEEEEIWPCPICLKNGVEL